MIPDASVDFVFSFDSFVHPDREVVEAYLRQLGTKLKIGGKGFIHHSNFGEYVNSPRERLPEVLAKPLIKAKILDWAHHRNPSMTAELFRALSAENGLQCLSQESPGHRPRTIAAAGQHLAEEDDVGLDVARASGRSTGATFVDTPGPRRAGELAPQSTQLELRIEPWTSITLPRAGLEMEHVDVLGDHRFQQARGDRARRAPRGRGSADLPSRVGSAAGRSPRSATDRRGRHDVGDLHRVDLLPEALAGGAEVGDARGHRDARAGQGDRAVERGPVQEQCSLRRPRDGRWEPRMPCLLALPLRAALAEEGGDALRGVLGARKAFGEAGLLGLDALVEVALVGDELDLLDRERRLAGELSRPARSPRRAAPRQRRA